MLGSNRDENKLFMIYDPELVDWWLGAIPRAKDKDLYMAIAEHQANAWKARSVDRPASIMRAVQGDSVYAYRWDWDEEPGLPLLYDGGEMVGAGHGLEIPFVFGHFDLGPETGMLFNASNRSGRLALSAQMMSYWAEFAYSGSPGTGRSGDLPLWRSWDNSDLRSPKYMVLDTSISGGSRMETAVYSIDGIVASLVEDSRIESVQSKCRLLRDMESWEYIDASEYGSAGNGLCGGYALSDYPWVDVAAE
jgi:para-nitrobenzyl esterase